VNIINVLPSSVINFDTPYHLLFNTQPDYNFYKTFGCAYYPLINKLNFCSSQCLFLGYNPQYKGYICESPSGKRYITRHVLFNEYVFPYSSCFISSDTTQSPAMQDTFSTHHLTVINSTISASPSTPSSHHPSSSFCITITLASISSYYQLITSPYIFYSLECSPNDHQR